MKHALKEKVYPESYNLKKCFRMKCRIKPEFVGRNKRT